MLVPGVTPTPTIIVQIDKCLLRGKRPLRKGNAMNSDDRMTNNGNYGVRKWGPWIFRLVNCIKTNINRMKPGFLTSKEKSRLSRFDDRELPVSSLQFSRFEQRIASSHGQPL
ncbi:hypothetical protein RF11_03819 [Thelohanellus kitauei]|uniref:Uncharacterized protein n=1 Tax=Thelohanellus kitauei TaxID=669202 RepID=A0A0C2MNU3_THEKT|nr:hypothetical protein RF11_03819 [Thelohanellus kitauei]